MADLEKDLGMLEVTAYLEEIKSAEAAWRRFGSEEVSASVEEQTATMSEVANAANDLQGLVEDLNNAISKFKF